MINLTLQEARRFLLLWQGLLGEYRFKGKAGALEYVRQAGCIQFDPVDACGKNAELTLQSRVKGFTKKMLYTLLYRDHALIDYPDKNLSIMPVEDWPYFERYRAAARKAESRFEGLAELETEAKEHIRKHGSVSSKELPIKGNIYWHSTIHWSGNWVGESGAARSVLEQLYSNGELVIHHKDGTRKYYDLAEKYIPSDILSAADPHPENEQHFKWRVLRRIKAVGMLWDRPSDAWLNIWGMKTVERNTAFQQLLEDEAIVAVNVEGIKGPLYLSTDALPMLEKAKSETKFHPRCELLAALDPMMWDRKLIKALFDFDYSWEIYTPAEKRKYGFYVLPLLYGDRFVGRVEALADRKNDTLILKNIWYEPGIRKTKALEKALNACLQRLAKFNELTNLSL